jgi:hypothetical protein
MADTAARLVDNVLPRVPVRQFVLSFPYEIRYRLAWDGELIAAVLKVFLRAVGCWYRRQAQALEYKDGRCGSVTFVQRFGSALNLDFCKSGIIAQAVNECGFFSEWVFW